MAYVLGFICADGNIVVTKRRNYYIALYTSDELLLLTMRNAMGSDHKVARRSARSGAVYRIQIGSKEWFRDLAEIGLMPNKARRMKLPNIPDKFTGDFVRGYFDGDGNVWTGIIHKNRKTQHLTLQVAFTSASKSFLKSLHSLLKKHGVSGGSIYAPRNDHFTRLSFSHYDALKLYKIMYNVPHKLYLKRKKHIFDRFMKNAVVV